MKRINGNAKRRRRENQGAGEVGCGEGVSCPPPHRGRGLGRGCSPSAEKNLILALNMVSFGAFWMVFFFYSSAVLQAKPEFNRYRRMKAVMVTGEYRPR